MSKSIARRRPVVGGAGSAAGADNDRRPEHRQARHRRAAAAASLLGLMLLAVLTPVAVAEEDTTQTAPLEIQRQQIDGRLGTIERKEEDRGPAPAIGSRLDPYEPAPAPSETRGARHRLDLERRTLEGRREGIDRDLERSDPGSSPSSGGLLDRLRRN